MKHFGCLVFLQFGTLVALVNGILIVNSTRTNFSLRSVPSGFVDRSILQYFVEKIDQIFSEQNETLRSLEEKVTQILLLTNRSDSSRDNSTANFDRNVIVKPKARLYSGLNYMGEAHVDYSSDNLNPNDCTWLHDLVGEVKSIDTYGTCIRLYTRHDCTGGSMAYYPSEQTDQWPTNLVRESTLDLASAIGPCFDNELDQSESQVNDEGIRQFVKLTVNNLSESFFVPDWVTIGSFEEEDDQSTVTFREGYKGRLDFLHVRLTRKRLMSGQRNTQVDQKEWDFYSRLTERNVSDTMGHFISPSLFNWDPRWGVYNIFPQSAWNRIVLEKRNEKILNLLRDGQNVKIYITVEYETSQSMRPIGMIHRINFVERERRENSIVYITNLY